MASGKNYFEDLLCNDDVMRHGSLDRLVDEINETKDRTIYKFLSDSGSEDFLWSLVTLLSSSETRVASNAAYVIGSLAETELGAQRVLSLTKGRKAASIMKDLTKMLTSDDPECVMNAAGTLGTLAETNEGRGWMICQPCIDEVLTNITTLLGCENNWTASNAALVLARITISEDGCHSVLNHPNSSYILTRLIQSLGNDAAGRGMNSAFAIGRLLDMAPGKKRLLNCNETEKMISTLCRMLTKGDMGSAKNACFAVSCLAADGDGNQRVLGNNAFADVLSRLLLLLANEEDIEAAWFSAMTLRTLSCHKQGVLRLRENEHVTVALHKNLEKSTNSKELNEEIRKTLALLKKLDCPDSPVVTNVSSSCVSLSWKKMEIQSGLEITYKLYNGQKLVYKGKSTETRIEQLIPNTTHGFKLRASTLGDDSPYSEVVYVTTDEDVPSAPCCLRVVGSTPSQLRFSWNPPEFPNGVLRGYSIFLGDKLMETTPDLTYIFGRLNPSTTYNIHVCASTTVGLGEKASISATTEELGAHAPGRPSVTVIGRNEAHVTWNPPAVPLGRFFRFELLANKDVIYSGTNRVHKATNLIPDTDYSFSVCAITSEGRCEGEATKKRTLKDKSQVEPGRHKHKTHSFKAKEFQMVEKAKTQIKIERPKIKKKLSLGRPSSCVSSISAKSKGSGSKVGEGIWASENSPSSGDSPEIPARKTNAVLTGGSSKGKPPAPPNGHLSMFLRKTKSEYPIRSRRSLDPPVSQKVLIEPVSWDELLTSDDHHQHNVPRKQVPQKQKIKPKSDLLETEKSYINLITNKNPNLPQVTQGDKQRSEFTHDMQIFREKHVFKLRGRRKKRIPSSENSDSSSDEIAHLPQNKGTRPKLIPLSMADLISNSLAKSSDYNLVDQKTGVSRIKTPSKGYWSDHDAYTSLPQKKSGQSLAPINYKTFTGAHRPSRSYRQESPLVGDTWLADLPTNGLEKNKYKFIPTQLRTQPLNLPKPVMSRHRLESLTQLDLRHDSSKKQSKIQHEMTSLFQSSSLERSPRGTKIIVKDNTTSPHASSPFRSNLLTDDHRYSPHRAIVGHGDAV
ncbi:uncharacterized protein LOC100180399 [Ciona intestinalis]